VGGQDKERAALEMAGMFFIPRGREFETMLLIHVAICNLFPISLK
jgi:hypothetical protein